MMVVMKQMKKMTLKGNTVHWMQ